MVYWNIFPKKCSQAIILRGIFIVETIIDAISILLQSGSSLSLYQSMDSISSILARLSKQYKIVSYKAIKINPYIALKRAQKFFYKAFYSYHVPMIK